MAMHPLHVIRSGKRQNTGEHLVEGDAERIEVAARVDRTVHSSSLLGGHVGKCACEGPGKRYRLSRARKARCNAEPVKPNLACSAVYQDVRRLYILMDEAALMELAQSHG